jgi:hypothetical protein
MNNTMKKGIMLLVLALLVAGGVFAQRVGNTYTLDGSSWTVETVSGDRMTLLKAQGVMTFTSISAFKTWIDAQPTNTAANPYNVKINISDLGGHASNSGTLGNAIYVKHKYVYLDCSGSTFTSIPAGAFFNCSFVGMTIPKSVTSIGNLAFASSNYTSMTYLGTIPSSGYAAGCTARTAFYATDKTNGTPGTYTTTAPVSKTSVWTKL